VHLAVSKRIHVVLEKHMRGLIHLKFATARKGTGSFPKSQEIVSSSIRWRRPSILSKTFYPLRTAKACRYEYAGERIFDPWCYGFVHPDASIETEPWRSRHGQHMRREQKGHECVTPESENISALEFTISTSITRCSWLSPGNHLRYPGKCHNHRNKYSTDLVWCNECVDNSKKRVVQDDERRWSCLETMPCYSAIICQTESDWDVDPTWI